MSFTARASEASARAGPGAVNPVHVGVEEKLPPMFIHALYSLGSEAVRGPSSEVKLNPGVF